MEAKQKQSEEIFHRRVIDFLKELNHLQGELLELQQEKRTSLVVRDLEQTSRIHQQEHQLHQKLQFMLDRRRELLTTMRSEGIAGTTLKEVCRYQGWSRDLATEELLKEARELSDALRQVSWGNWVFTHRASQYYTGLLEMIARGGKKNSIYHDGSTTQQQAGGGSLLDASI